jgi:hypothetical protein
VSERLQLSLSKRDLELISTSFVVDSELQDKIKSQSVELDPMELEFLLEGAATEANHADTKSLEKDWSRICTKIEYLLENQ